MKRPILWPIVATVSVAVIVFAFGNATNHELLQFQIGPGSLEITFAPVLMGIAAGSITERITIKMRQERKEQLS